VGLKLYCNRFVHFKDSLVCSVNCPYRERCHDFALFYDEHREEIDREVKEYYAKHSQPQKVFHSIVKPVSLRELIKLEVKKIMSTNSFIWISKDGQAELVTLEEILRRAEDGAKAKKIYKVAQEMELKFQLVPRKRIESAKRVVAIDEARAAAKRAARKQTTLGYDEEEFENTTVPARTAEPPARTRRRRAAATKAIGE
jgi:hypothetical protein